MAVVAPKFHNYSIFEQWVFMKYSFKLFFSNTMATNSITSLINEFKALIVAYLISSNYTNRAKLLTKVHFFINFISNVIEAFFDEKYLIALL